MDTQLEIFNSENNGTEETNDSELEARINSASIERAKRVRELSKGAHISSGEHNDSDN